MTVINTAKDAAIFVNGELADLRAGGRVGTGPALWRRRAEERRGMAKARASEDLAQVEREIAEIFERAADETDRIIAARRLSKALI